MWRGTQQTLRRQTGGTQEASKRHSGDTQEPPRYTEVLYVMKIHDYISWCYMIIGHDPMWQCVNIMRERDTSLRRTVKIRRDAISLWYDIVLSKYMYTYMYMYISIYSADVSWCSHHLGIPSHCLMKTCHHVWQHCISTMNLDVVPSWYSPVTATALHHVYRQCVTSGATSMTYHRHEARHVITIYDHTCHFAMPFLASACLLLSAFLPVKLAPCFCLSVCLSVCEAVFLIADLCVSLPVYFCMASHLVATPRVFGILLAVDQRPTTIFESYSTPAVYCWALDVTGHRV